MPTGSTSHQHQLQAVRNETRRLVRRLGTKVEQTKAQGQDQFEVPLSVGHALELAKALDAVMAALSWHQHNYEDEVNVTSSPLLQEGLDLS